MALLKGRNENSCADGNVLTCVTRLLMSRIRRWPWSECAVEEKKAKQRTDHLLLSRLQLESIIDVILIQFDEFWRVRPKKRPIRSKPGSFFPQEVSCAHTFSPHELTKRLMYDNRLCFCLNIGDCRSDRRGASLSCGRSSSVHRGVICNVLKNLVRDERRNRSCCR